jgi:hypothetical protein
MAPTLSTLTPVSRRHIPSPPMLVATSKRPRRVCCRGLDVSGPSLFRRFGSGTLREKNPEPHTLRRDLFDRDVTRGFSDAQYAHSRAFGRCRDDCDDGKGTLILRRNAGCADRRWRQIRHGSLVCEASHARLSLAASFRQRRDTGRRPSERCLSRRVAPGWPIRISLFGFDVAPVDCPLQGALGASPPERCGIGRRDRSEHWFSARHSESEDRRFRFAQPLPQDVLHIGERGWLATASSLLAGCRRPSIGLEQASASQNDICTRRLRAMRSSGAEISASISFAQTWPATFDLNSRRTVNVRPLTS